MTPKQRRQLCAAPEIIVLDLTGAALVALRLALLAQHPLLGDELAAQDDPPIQRRARRLLRHAEQVRRALRHYRRAVLAELLEPDQPELPF